MATIGELAMINLTPHAITIVSNTETGETITIQPFGIVARVSTKSIPMPEYQGVPVIRTVYGDVEGMPNYPTPCLVSGMVLAQLGEEWRGIAFAPATGPSDGAIRSDGVNPGPSGEVIPRGQIHAVTKLVTV